MMALEHRLVVVQQRNVRAVYKYRDTRYQQVSHILDEKAMNPLTPTVVIWVQL